MQGTHRLAYLSKPNGVKRSGLGSESAPRAAVQPASGAGDRREAPPGIYRHAGPAGPRPGTRGEAGTRGATIVR
jgi:hypothetical protein